uniref:Late embryogenesis abundant protein LEA-2 subgroup domain-containing protein n=1 Tax=Leersia perrieri TaxID=77586 RepID=A0A0D9WL62_9ORYZ
MGGGDGKLTKFPWLGVARYAATAVLAAMVAATAVAAVKMVLRPVELDLSVANGAVSVERPSSPAAAALVKYKVTLRAYNPSGRAVVHVGGDNQVRLLYGATAQTELAAFTLAPFVVPRQESHYVPKSGFLNASALPASLAARLYDGETDQTDQVVVQAVASLWFTVVGARAGGRRGHNFTFHCWPVSISSYYEVSGDDASCSQESVETAVAGLAKDRCIGGPCPEPYSNSGNCSVKSPGHTG